MIYADTSVLDTTIRAWNGVIAAAAHRHGAILVDLYSQGPELAAHAEFRKQLYSYDVVPVISRGPSSSPSR